MSRITLRLTPTDEAVLERLCAVTGQERSAVIRQAIRENLSRHAPLPPQGWFVPCGKVAPLPLCVRLTRKVVHDA